MDLALTTKRNFYKEFHSLLNFAVRMEYLPKNPLNAIGTFTDIYFEKPQDKLHYYTPEQFQAYIAVARDSAVTLIDWGY